MRMRRLLAAMLALALALTAAGAVHAASRSVKQAITGQVKPRKQPKRKFRNVKIHIRTATADAADSSLVPPVANRALIDFDNDLIFRPRSAARCPLSRIDGKSTADARSACRKALVGWGKAGLRLGNPGDPPLTSDIPVKVSAFNGQLSGGHPTVILHSDPGFTPVDLIGRLIKSPRGRDWGRRLDVTIPPTGGSLTFFDVTVKHGRYVRARCHDRNHRWNFHGRFLYDDSGGTYPASADAYAKQRCYVKRLRRHRRRRR
jgi:hypothetical protein